MSDSVKYSISGKIEGSDGSSTEFEILADYDSWRQWIGTKEQLVTSHVDKERHFVCQLGGTKEQLGARVEMLEAMADGLRADTDYFNQGGDSDEENAG